MRSVPLSAPVPYNRYMQSRFGAANEQMRDALARVSPGTPLRDGIERIVSARDAAGRRLRDFAPEELPRWA